MRVRWLVALGMGSLGLVAGCTTQPAPSEAASSRSPAPTSTTTATEHTPRPTPSSSSLPPASASPTATPTLAVADGVATADSGNVAKSVPATAEILDESGAVLFRLTIDAVQDAPTCPSEFGGKSENGTFVIAEVTAELAGNAPPDFVVPLGPAAWRIPESTASLETSAAWTCFSTEQRLPYAILPGEQLAGKVVLDTDATSGRIAFQPGGFDGWEWTY